jgi:predicted  nucleic acid-binding Zn-ribbon protein
MSDDILEYLESKPLVGFQMDATHLHNVLQSIVRSQQQSAQTQVAVSRRLQGLESAVQDINDRVGQLESAISRVGGGEEVRSLKVHLQDLSAVVDNISRQALPEVRRACDDIRRSLNPIERNVQQLHQAIGPLEASQETLRQYVEDIAKDSQNTARQLASQVSQVQLQSDEVDRERQVELNRVGELIREVQARTDRIERGGGAGGAQLRELYDELNIRSNDNFRAVEISAKAVDTELNRMRSDLANVRTELNTLDNNTRQKVARVTDDMDTKFNMLLESLHQFERNSTELEDHLAAAGRVLASSRQAGHTAGPRSTTTVSSSSARGHTISSEVRRNVAGDLSDPRRGGSQQGW